MSELKIIFPTEEAKLIFARWLCVGGGEQDYLQAMESSAAPRVGLRYHPKYESYALNDKRRYGKFLADDTIRVFMIKELCCTSRFRASERNVRFLQTSRSA